ncbi:AIR synthase-related protein, partial [Acinetobacter baumannii]
PYLGFAVGIIAAVIASLFQFGMDWTRLLLVGVVFMIGQAVECYILQPFLLGDKIGLSPVAVVFPNGAQAVINEASWEWPELFKLLQREGNVERFEMYRTFNCGVGMVIAVDANDAEKAIEVLNAQGE